MSVTRRSPSVVRAMSVSAGDAPVSSMYTTAAPVTSCVRYAVFPPGVSSRSIFFDTKAGELLARAGQHGAPAHRKAAAYREYEHDKQQPYDLPR